MAVNLPRHLLLAAALGAAAASDIDPLMSGDIRDRFQQATPAAANHPLWLYAADEQALGRRVRLINSGGNVLIDGAVDQSVIAFSNELGAITIGHVMVDTDYLLQVDDQPAVALTTSGNNSVIELGRNVTDLRVSHPLYIVHE